MFDPITAALLFVTIVICYVWFSTTKLCDRFFTLPGRMLIGIILFTVSAMYLPEAKADEHEILQVVQLQIEAFEGGDATMALALMTADTQKKFNGTVGFRQWIKTNMPILFWHHKTVMGRQSTAKEYILQPVLFSYGAETYAVTFFMLKIGGDWKIDNIVMLPIRLFGV